MDVLAMLAPEGFSPSFAIGLVAVSFVTGALTAAFSVGGGITLLTVMASVLPMTTVVPVHGLVQLGSNGGRSILLAKHIRWRETALFLSGGVIGAAVGGVSVTNLPDAPMKAAVGVFVMALVWGPKPAALGRSDAAMAIGGAFGGALSMAFGATGPWTAALLNTRGMARQALSATFSACMSGQHFLKALVFVALGFAFAEWLTLIAAMIVAGFGGTVVGVRVLQALPERVFQIALKAVLTGLALRLTVTGLMDVWASGG